MANKVITNFAARQPVLPVRGTGLNANHQPKLAVKAIVNTDARKK
jgi:hypothetical protein